MKRIFTTPFHVKHVHHKPPILIFFGRIISRRRENDLKE